jgi:hypothetical protein
MEENVENANNANNPNENPPLAPVPVQPPEDIPVRELSEAPRSLLPVQGHVIQDDGDTGAPRRRKIPQQHDPLTSSAQSPYFPAGTSSSSAAPTFVDPHLMLSPVRPSAAQPVVVDLEGESGEDDEDLEFREEMLMDEVFLEEVDRIERSAMSQRASMLSTTAPRDVIVIDDSDQEEESVPVLNRRVRRRTGDAMPPSQAPSTEDVIEIMSD